LVSLPFAFGCVVFDFSVCVCDDRVLTLGANGVADGSFGDHLG